MQSQIKPKLASLFRTLCDHKSCREIASLEQKHLKRLAGVLTQAALQDATIGVADADKARVLASEVVRDAFRAASEKSPQERVLQFYSGSKDTDDLFLDMPHWRRVLSNFHPLRHADPAMPPNGMLLDGRRFLTVEHYFQVHVIGSGHVQP